MVLVVFWWNIKREEVARDGTERGGGLTDATVQARGTGSHSN